MKTIKNFGVILLEGTGFAISRNRFLLFCSARGLLGLAPRGCSPDAVAPPARAKKTSPSRRFRQIFRKEMAILNPYERGEKRWLFMENICF